MSPTPQNPDDYDSLAAQHVSLRRVLALFRPFRKRIATVIVLMLIASATGLAGPFLLRAIIDDALPRNDLKLLSLLVAGMILVALVSAIIGAWQVVLSSRIGQAVLHDLRVRLYAHLQNLSLRFFTGTRVEVQSRIANDVDGLQSLVSDTANELGRSLSSVIMTSIAIIILDWRLALLVLFIVPEHLLSAAVLPGHARLSPFSNRAALPICRLPCKKHFLPPVSYSLAQWAVPRT